MKFWRSKGFAFLAAWSDDCFEESNVEINCHMGKRKTHPMAARCRRDSKLRCNPWTSRRNTLFAGC
jgi:hypothetical protein